MNPLTHPKGCVFILSRVLTQKSLLATVKPYTLLLEIVMKTVKIAGLNIDLFYIVAFIGCIVLLFATQQFEALIGAIIIAALALIDTAFEEMQK